MGRYSCSLAFLKRFSDAAHSGQDAFFRRIPRAVRTLALGYWMSHLRGLTSCHSDQGGGLGVSIRRRDGGPQMPSDARRRRGLGSAPHACMGSVLRIDAFALPSRDKASPARRSLHSIVICAAGSGTRRLRRPLAKAGSPSALSSAFSRFARISFAREMIASGSPARRATWIP